MTVSESGVDAPSVEIRDPQVQASWSPVDRAGVGELAGQYVLAVVLLGVARAGISRRLSRGWTPLVRLLPPGADPVLVRNTLRYLQLRGVVEARDVRWVGTDLDPATPGGGSWRLTERGDALLGDVGESLLGFYVDAYGPVLDRLDGLLTGELRYGRDVSRDTEALGRRCEPMTISFLAALVRRLLDERGARSVLELGCGTGGLLLHLASADPALRAVGLDIAPDAVALAARRTGEQGLADRVRFVVGDAFAPGSWPPEASSCDLVLAVGALHECFRDGRDAVVELLSRYRELLAGGRGRAMLLVEPELHVDAVDADYYLAHVLTAQGFPAPRSVWLPVIREAGLTCTRVFSQPHVAFRFACYEIVAGGAA